MPKKFYVIRRRITSRWTANESGGLSLMHIELPEVLEVHVYDTLELAEAHWRLKQKQHA